MSNRARKTPPKRSPKPKRKAARSERPPPDPLSQRASEFAALLSRAGGVKVAAGAVLADVKAGAPVGPGGVINVVEYAAWLLRESARGD